MSLQENETLAGWTLLYIFCLYFWAWLLNKIAITPKSEDKYVVKVFNPTEFHFSEVTFFQNWYFSNPMVKNIRGLGLNPLNSKLYLQHHLPYWSKQSWLSEVFSLNILFFSCYCNMEPFDFKFLPIKKCLVFYLSLWKKF